MLTRTSLSILSGYFVWYPSHCLWIHSEYGCWAVFFLVYYTSSAIIIGKLVINSIFFIGFYRHVWLNWVRRMTTLVRTHAKMGWRTPSTWYDEMPSTEKQKNVCANCYSREEKKDIFKFSCKKKSLHAMPYSWIRFFFLLKWFSWWL